MKKTVAILALQGSFGLHQEVLERVGSDTKLVKRPSELIGADVLVIPGGESSSLLKLMTPLSWQGAIIDFHKRGGLIFGTCAGMIVLSKSNHPSQKYLGLIEIDVRRNAYGRQLDSFTAKGTNSIGLTELEMVCIRSPQVISVGEKVEVLASLGEDPMLLKQENVVVATFHPEIGQNSGFYHWLINQISPDDSK